MVLVHLVSEEEYCAIARKYLVHKCYDSARVRDISL